MPDREMPPIERLLEVGEGAPSLAERMAIVEQIRRQSPLHGHRLDMFFLEHLERRGLGLEEAQDEQAKLRAFLDEMTATPWHQGIFLRAVSTQFGPRALVALGNARRLVAPANGLQMEALSEGDEVFLSQEMNVVMAKSPVGAPTCGEMGFFERRLPDGRLVLKSRDEEVVVEPAGALRQADLQPGDLLRFDRGIGMAYEKLERDEGREFILTEVPDIAASQVGGQDESLDLLLSALTSVLLAPERAAAYGLTGRQSILLIGPPGCGKTLMARVAASEISRCSGQKCTFAMVKPGQFEDPYVGVTQQRIRAFFAVLRAAAKLAPAVAFLDEIEAIGRMRGSFVGHHSDKFLAALLAELDGFAERSGVAIIAATNRKDLIDPALLERLSDIEIEVNRPSLEGARAIFGIHLPASLDYHRNGSDAAATREAIIETAVSRLYSPNGEADLCRLRFRDGKVRTVSARELASGRLFEQVCRAARRSAFLREMRGGEPGLVVEDIEHALATTLRRMRTTLSPRNVHQYLPDLPADVDILEVQSIEPRVHHPRRYLNLGVH